MKKRSREGGTTAKRLAGPRGPFSEAAKDYRREERLSGTRRRTDPLRKFFLALIDRFSNEPRRQDNTAARKPDIDRDETKDDATHRGGDRQS